MKILVHLLKNKIYKLENKVLHLKINENKNSEKDLYITEGSFTAEGE